MKNATAFIIILVIFLFGTVTGTIVQSCYNKRILENLGENLRSAQSELDDVRARNRSIVQRINSSIRTIEKLFEGATRERDRINQNKKLIEAGREALTGLQEVIGFFPGDNSNNDSNHNHLNTITDALMEVK